MQKRLLILSCALLFILQAAAAPSQEHRSAWQILAQESPGLINDSSIRAVERRVLQKLTPAQLQDFLDGRQPSAILLSDGRSLEEFLIAYAKGLDFEVPWYSIDGGGLTLSMGNLYLLGGTIGQPDAGSASGGDFELTGGFWAPPLLVGEPDPIFSDGFESGDLTAW